MNVLSILMLGWLGFAFVGFSVYPFGCHTFDTRLPTFKEWSRHLTIALIMTPICVVALPLIWLGIGNERGDVKP